MAIKSLIIGGVIIAGSIGGLITDSIYNEFDDKGLHYELPITTNFKQGERIEIAKDKAEIKLIGWQDEYSVTITPQNPETGLTKSGEIAKTEFVTEASRDFLSKRIEYKEGDITAFIEPKSGVDNEFDIDFIIDVKPSTNIFKYKIAGAEDFDFFYQAPLTADEIKEGSFRPDNVVGSYAVYHKTKFNHRVGGTNYGSGKAFHIYRPKAIDANGQEVWSQLMYENGILSVIVPQKFLDTAVYPVIVDPTFGYTTIGGSTLVGGGANAIRGGQAISGADAEGASVTDFSFATANFVADTKTLIIASSTLTILTNGIGPNVSVNTGATATWATSTFSSYPILSANTGYFLGLMHTGAEASWNYYYDSAPGTGLRRIFDGSNSYATPTDPTDATFPDGATFRKFSFYVTYTVAAPATTDEDMGNNGVSDE